MFTEAMAYSRAGARVKVLTPHVPGLKKREEIFEGFEVHRFRYFFPERMQRVRIKNAPLYSKEHLFPRILQFPLFLGAFFFSVARSAPAADLIHANWTPLALLALPFQWLLRVPVAVTYRGSDVRLMPKPLNRFIFSKVAAVLHAWGDTGRGELIRSRYPGKFVDLPIISRIPKAPPSDAFCTRNPHEPFRFAYIGRLFSLHSVPKGEDIVIWAASILGERHENFIIHILGDGPFREAMEQETRTRGIESLVQFHGYVRDVFPVLDKCQAVIGALALNAVAQEAAFYKRLLIMADFPSLNGRIWVNRFNALLYRPHDANSLAEAMAFVIEEPNTCRRICLKGHETMKRYVVNIERGGRIYISAFRKLIQKK